MKEFFAANDEHGQPAFHVFLNTSFRRNEIRTTLPDDLVRKAFNSDLFYLENAMFHKPKTAQRLLGQFANKMLENVLLKPYYYPDYLKNTGVSEQLAECFIDLKNGFFLREHECYSESSNTLEFFYLQQQFNMNRASAIKTGLELSFEEFLDRFTPNVDVLICLSNSNSITAKYYKFVDDFHNCGGVVDEGELKMFVTV